MSKAHVYTGVWTDHSRGSVYGTTLTLGIADANYLIAFLSLFVAFVGTRCWRIVAFAIHQLRASDTPRDVLQWQSQVILANSVSHYSTAYELLRLEWSWRKLKRKSIRRLILIQVAALAIAGAFGVAGVFSSRVTHRRGDNVVLVRPTNCGFPGSANETTSMFSDVEALERLVQSVALDASTYVARCYEGSTDSDECHFYPTTKLPLTIDTNATCPFSDPARCLDDLAVSYDTGYISSDYLGVNAITKDRISVRKVAVCTPAIPKINEIKNLTRQELYALQSYVQGEPSYPTDEILVALLGPVSGGFSNISFQYNYRISVAGVGYQLSALTATPGTAGEWSPVSDFQRADADVTMIFLTQNSIEYIGEVNDPVFAAHKGPPLPTAESLREGDYDLKLIACTDQHQICNPGGSKTCTPLTSANLLGPETFNIGLGDYQLAIANRYLKSVRGRSGAISLLPETLGPAALQAQSLIAVTDYGSSYSPALPDDQWLIETRRWFEGSLSYLQQAFFTYASTSKITDLGITVTPPPTSVLQGQCNDQKIISTGQYESFSVLGLSIILGVGGIIILTSMCLEFLVALVRARFARSVNKTDQYEADHLLQLHHRAHRHVYPDEWSGEDDHVPIPRYYGRENLHLSTRNREMRTVSSPNETQYSVVPKVNLPLGDRGTLSEQIRSSTRSRPSDEYLTIMRDQDHHANAGDHS